MKKLIAILLAAAMVMSMCIAVAAQETSEPESTLIDLQDYLWEIPDGASADEMMLLLNRNNTIIEDMESLFEPGSISEYQKAFSKFRQNKKTATAEDARKVAQNLVQIRSCADNVIFIWEGQEMPLLDGEEVTEEGLDKGQRLYSYGYEPRLILYPAENPQEAKGNMIVICRNHSADAVEGHPAATAYQELGYNVFALAVRSGPYSNEDSAMDLQRAIRVVKKTVEERNFGGSDMIAVASWGGAGVTEMNAFYNMYGSSTPADGYCSTYVPDEIDEISSDFDVAVMIYSAFEVLNEKPEETEGFAGYVVKQKAENPNLPAFYICAGDLDETGRYEDSLALYEEMKDKTDCVLHIMEGAGHGFGVGQEGAAHITDECKELLPESDEFMQEHRGYQNSKEASADNNTEDSEAAGSVQGILFPEAPEEFVKAKEFKGFYILMDTDVIFALNEDETRFAVKFNGIGGRPEYMEGDVHEDGTVKADDTYNGLYGEDLQTMYEDALEEESDWAPIVR